MRIRKKVHLAASVVAVTLAVLLLAACSSSSQRLSYGSGQNTYRDDDHVYGDYSSFRYGHHAYRRHLYRRHYFH